MASLSPSTLFFVVLPSAIALYIFSFTVYNVCFHHLAKFPGPKLAATTRWYEFFYDSVLGGRFSNHIYELHQGYGPTVRVYPCEVHIHDPECYDTLYNFNPELDKRWFAYVSFQNSPSFEVHKMRRRPFDPLFSRTSITRLEPLIHDLAEKMCASIEDVERKIRHSRCLCYIGA